MNKSKNIKIDGNIFGVVLNYTCLYEKRLSQFHDKPYLREPLHAVLFIKTPNTRNSSGHVVIKKKGEILQAGPTVGIIIGKYTSRVAEKDALSHIAGFVAVNELSLPEDSYYRPAIKAKCQDGFCVLGTPLSIENISNINDLKLRVYVNGKLKQQGSTENWIRSPAQIIEEISAYMPLDEGDIILTGTPYGRVDLNAEDEVRVEVDQLGSVTSTIQEEEN
jgi:5-oxopent-3-ene-1,2,5-tricarboxylate decarboxylase / 2-hydroxyhepta-2,4-diene-1,7-dioate isomerase